MPDELTLLERLVAIPSVSGEEGPLALFVEQTTRGWGLDVGRDDTSVRVEVRGRAPGPTLALVSHLDVVPPGAGWTRDPFTPALRKALQWWESGDHAIHMDNVWWGYELYGIERGGVGQLQYEHDREPTPGPVLSGLVPVRSCPP